MVKRKNNIYAFNIYRKTPDGDGNYIVTLESLKNTPSGNPRYKAVIVFEPYKEGSRYNAVYTFTGHYMGEQKEAEWILDKYLNNELD